MTENSTAVACATCGQPGAEKRMIVGTKTADGWPVYVMELCDGCFELEKAARSGTAPA